MSPVINTLADIIRRQKEEFSDFKALPYIVREREKQLRESRTSSLIKVVMGPRRAGKSRLIQKVLGNSEVAYLNFEEE